MHSQNRCQNPVMFKKDMGFNIGIKTLHSLESDVSYILSRPNGVDKFSNYLKANFRRFNNPAIRFFEKGQFDEQPLPRDFSLGNIQPIANGPDFLHYELFYDVVEWSEDLGGQVPEAVTRKNPNTIK